MRQHEAPEAGCTVYRAYPLKRYNMLGYYVHVDILLYKMGSNSDNPPKSGQIFPSTATVSLDLFLYLAPGERPADQVR